MSEMKNDPSELYDEEFLKKKEEFFDAIGDINKRAEQQSSEEAEVEEVGGVFSEAEEKKSKKKKKPSKKEAERDLSEPDYDIFDLDKYGDEDERFSKKGLKKGLKKKSTGKKAEKKAKKQRSAPAPAPQAPAKPREHKPFVAHKPVEMVETLTYKKDAERYKKPEIDIDGLLEELGVVPAEKEQDKPEEMVNISSSSDSAEEDAVKAFEESTDISSNAEEAEISAEPSQNTEPSDDSKKDTVSGFTKHFNLKSHIKNNGKNGDTKSRNIMKGFRVLKNKSSDEAILEAMPVGDGKDSMMDTVPAKQGEDVFRAVENAHRDGDEMKKEDIKHRLAIVESYKEALEKKLSSEKTSLMVLGGIGLITLILTVLSYFYSEGGALEFMFGHGGVVYGVLNLLLFAGTAFVARKEIVAGIKGIRYFNLDKNTVMVVLGFFVLIFNCITMLTGTIGTQVQPYTLCFIFAVAVRYGSIFAADSSAMAAATAIVKNGGECQGLYTVQSKNDAISIAHGLSEKTDLSILYFAGSNSDTCLKEERLDKKNEERFYSFSCMAVIIVSFISAIAILIKDGDSSIFLTALISCLSLCLPIAGELTSSLLFFTENRRLLNYGGFISDYESAEKAGRANAVISDAEDIFDCEVTRFKKVRGASVIQSDAAVFAAAALTAGGSMLAKCFDEFIEELGIDLPEAEDVQYEEKLGISCWIINKRVLVGNREMLVQHSIDAPSKEEEKIYAGKKFVMYVAVEGEVIATFLVQYKAKKRVRKLMPDFSKSGLVLLLNSKEPCIDELESAKRLSVEASAVKLLSNKALTTVESYKKHPERGEATSLICLKEKNGALPLAVGAHNLFNINRAAAIIHLACQCLALVIAVVGNFLDVNIFINPIAASVFHALCSAVTVISVSDYTRSRIVQLASGLFKKGGKKK